MGRIAPVVAALVAPTTIAWAGPTHRIRVETTPPKAHVYVDEIELGAKCEATPCEFDAPIGDVVLIVRLDGYQPAIETVQVARAHDKKPQLFTFSLKPAVTTLICDDPKAKGATIQIEGKDKGKCPGRVELEPGGHQVVLKLAGKVVYEEFLDFDAGDEKAIELAGGKPGAKASKSDGDGNDQDDSDDSDDTDDRAKGDHRGAGDDEGNGGAIAKPGPPPPRARVVNAQLMVDVGWRRFAYSNVMNGSSLPPTENESGQVIAGPGLEVWPTELLHAAVLRGLSVFLRAELQLNQLDVKDSSGIALAKTSWSSYEASVRYRWQFGDLGVEVGAGYVRDQIAYDLNNGAPQMVLPSADYQSVRVGARGFLRRGELEPYVAAESRIVMSGGDLGNRYTNASATGVRGALGVAATTGPIYVRLEGSYLQYSWSYPTNVSSPPPATGASDQIFGVSVTAGYQY
jgi:hypothetical protein